MSNESLGFLSVEKSLPFEQLFVPAVLDAREELRRQVATSVHARLTAQAHAGWERYLLIRLSATSANAADWQFQIFLSAGATFSKDRSIPRGGRDALSQKFVGERPQERLEKLFREFPALVQLHAVLVKNWLSTVEEFLIRLDADHEGLRGHFPSDRFVGPIASLQAGLSDPHRGGRVVVRAYFEEGGSLIYKPRSIASEAHFSKLFDFLNTQEPPHLLRGARCWNRGDHGWMEDIAPAPCSAVDGLHAFYWRAGVLLGLVHLAHGVDFHRGNIIANGEFPVLIDLETLGHLQNHIEDRQATMNATVLRTGFLPYYDVQSGNTYEWSALCRAASQEHGMSRPERNLRREGIGGSRSQPAENSGFLPSFEGAFYAATDFVGDIQNGYLWLGERLLTHEKGKAKFDEWLWLLTKCPRRLLLRSSADYQNFLRRFISPAALRQSINEYSFSTGSAQNSNPNGAKEISALKQLDIPYFEQNDLPGDPLFPAGDFESYISQASLIAEALNA